MSGHRPGARLIRLATAFTALAFYALWIRPRMLTWGATLNETIGTYSGDELVPDPNGGATMATFLPAAPERVWPWLVQIGGGRAGWYSWDWLDNNGEPSADRVVPEWQNLEAAAFEGPDELVERGGSGAEPDPGAAVELRVVDGPVLRSRAASGVRGGDLGLPSAAGCRR